MTNDKIIAEIERLLAVLKEQTANERSIAFPDTARNVVITFSDGTESEGWYDNVKHKWFARNKDGWRAVRTNKKVVAWRELK